MDKDYYNDALKWYDAIYIRCARDRNIFIAIFAVLIFCLFQVFSVLKIFYNTKDDVKQYVVYTNRNAGLSLKLQQFNINEGVDGFLYKFLITKYIENMEKLNFNKNNKSAMHMLHEKAQIIKNTSSSSVYQKYIDGVYKDDYGDLSLLLSNQQKDISIEKIDFLSQQSMLTDKVYSIISKSQPNIANVIFTARMFSNQSEIKKRYRVQITFSLNRGKIMETNQAIDFKVYDYSKVEIKE